MNFKIFSILFLAFLLSSCTNVKILDASAENSSDVFLNIKMRTDKNIEQYEGSFFANHVYLKYKTSNMASFKLIDSASNYWEYPFSVTEYTKEQCAGEGVCYLWKIPLKDKTSINAINYEYQLTAKDTVTIKIGGGTMHGSRLSSNAKTVSFK